MECITKWRFISILLKGKGKPPTRLYEKVEISVGWKIPNLQSSQWKTLTWTIFIYSFKDDKNRSTSWTGNLIRGNPTYKWNKTVPTVPNNKPDIVVWKKNENKCFIIDICVPLDQNIHKQEKMKIDNYTLLTIGLYRLYPNYSYEVFPIILGATGLVTNSLVTYMSKLFDKSVSLEIIPKLQQKALIGSMRVIKSALSMKDWMLTFYW